MYDDISKYYDLIFPYNKTKHDFLNKHLKKDKVLDLACGTGTYSLKLAQDGYEVTGYDLDANMIKRARQKSENKNPNFQVRNMLELDFVNVFDSVFCIGNSLVHLDNLSDVKEILTKIYKSLKDEGKLVIQIVNYDRVLDNDVKSLPTITKDNVTFKRDYDVHEDYVNFNTELKVDNESYSNTVKLLPIRSEELMSMLNEIGFKVNNKYGSFNEEEYKLNESFHLIIECEK